MSASVHACKAQCLRRFWITSSYLVGDDEVGETEAPTMRRQSMPISRHLGSTTASGSPFLPNLHVRAVAAIVGRRLDAAERLDTPKNNATFCDAQPPTATLLTPKVTGSSCHADRPTPR